MKTVFSHIISSTSGRIGLFILFVFCVIGIFGPMFISGNIISASQLEIFHPPGNGKVAYYLFGTDQIGRDVFEGIIHGTRWALIIGSISVLVAAFIGIVLGTIAGYFGDTELKIGLIPILIFLTIVFFAIFYISHARFTIGLKVISFILILLFSFMLSSRMNRIMSRRGYKQISFPADFFVSRLIEVWKAVPALFILLAALSLAKKPSLIFVAVLIGVLSWTRIARLLRAEIIKIRNLEYIQAAKGLAYSNVRIIWNHVLPNSIRPLVILFAFGFAGAVILEASISFLGIGNNPDIMTWGSMLSAARQNYRAWWLAVFPGICISFLVLSLNLIADSLEI